MQNKTNIMTNDKANTIIGVVQTLMELKKDGTLVDLKFKWDEENNILDIFTVPKQAVQYIKCNFTITKEGAVFNE
jgi:hypothetical protein